MKTVLALAFLWATSALAEPAIPPQAVYPGCEQPPTTANHYWYFDPVNGDDAKGDGSPAKPWKTIAALFLKVSGNANTPLLSTIAANRTGVAPVNPGDAIVLRTGNYGDVTIGSGMPPHVDLPQWISVIPDNGAKPVFHSIYVGNTERWAFSGFEVQSGRVTTWTSMIEIAGNNNGGGKTHDIAFTNVKIDSADESVWRGWTAPEAWDANTRVAFSSRSGAETYCLAMTDLHLQAVAGGITAGSPQTLVHNTEIDHFIGDGIDILASDITLTNNRIHDVLRPQSGIHTDGIQGQIGRVPAGMPYVTYDNILIDSNWVQATADDWIRQNNLVNYLQGIIGTDGDWSHVTITNNAVVTHACHGINWASAHDSLVANNTVVWDGVVGGNCFPQLVAGGRTHQGPPTSNTTVINNLAPTLNFRADAGSWDHNVCVSEPGKSCLFAYTDPVGKVFYYSKPGVYIGNTLIDDSTKPGGSFNQFVLANNAALSYDLHLASDAQAKLWGTMTKAPSLSFGGGKRAINPGAY
jgi:hypothetical protein